MAASLAGARSVEDRRRRRLAKGADAAAGTRAPRRRGKADDDEKWRGSRLPLRKIISRHRWKILLLGVLLLLPAVGLGVAAFRMEQLSRRAGPAVADLLDPVQNRLGRAWGSFVLITSSALCVLIFWVRSRSPADFGGRYGVWLWAAAGAFVFSAATATGAHLTWADTVLHFRWVNFPQLGLENTRILCWFAPAAVFGLGLVRSVHLDMRRCWSSVLALWLAVAAWIGSAFLLSQTKWSVDIPHRELASRGAALLGHVSLVVSLLLHARFVLYENAAPPAEKSGSQGGRFSVVGLFGRLKNAAEAGEPEQAEPRKRAPGSSKKAKPKRASARRTKADESDSSEESSEEVDTSESGESEVESDSAEFDDATPRATIPANARVAAAPTDGRGSGGGSGGSGGGSSGGTSSRGNGSSGGSTSSSSDRSERSSHAAAQSRSASYGASHSGDDEDESDDDGDSGQGGPDRESLKGLSKRERRRLQKQWRDDQRKAG